MYSPEKDNNDTRTWPFNEACQMRLQELSDSLTEALAALKNDELLAAMFDDKTSKGFAKQRIREIIEECIDNDRETLIKHLYKQNALLQEDYNRLDEEYLKVFNEQKEMTSEFNNKINEMEREKRLLEDKFNNLKKSMQEKEEHYENQLKEKEEELFMRIEEYENSLKEKENRLINKTEVESREVLSMNSKLKELENKLKESEHKNQDLSHKYQDLSLKHTTLQSELDLQKAQIRDKDVMLQAKTGRYEEVNAAVSQYEASQKELKAEVERLIAENSKLEVSLEVYEEGKRAFEDDFRMRIQEIDKGIHNERATYQEKLNKQHKKYEAKMNQYKAKILEYKNKLTEKQKEFDESLKRTEESMFFQDKSSEMLKLKLEEELEFSNRKFQQLEEENNKKLKETSVMYESQMKRLETHFEELFHQKVSQIQEEVRQLQESLAEKTRLMERDYIRLSDHEEAIREKNSMISRLNQDILDKESQFNHELNYKMRELEKKVAEDYEKRQSMSERNVLELENRLSELRVQKKKTDTALTAVEGERNTLKEETESMVIQKRKLAEKAEEWHSKYQGLNVTYEAEKKRREEAEIKLREFQQKFSEVKRAYEALSGESAEKDIQTSKLADQLANVERRLLEKGSQYDALQGEFENLEKEYMRIREQLEISKRAETQNRVRATEAEEKIKVLNTEIQDSERRSERLKVQVETLDKQVADLSFRLSKTETNFSKTSKEKIELQKDFEKTLLKTKKLKQSNQNIGKTFAVKFAGLKSALREALSYYKVNISRLQKENELKIVELSKVFSIIMEKSKEKHQNEVENIKADLQEEMNYNHECLKDKYVRLQKDQTELFEQKCLDKDRTIKHLQEAQSKLTQKNMDLEVVLDRLEAKYSHLFEEKSHILQEKEELVQRLENQRKKYVEEINNFNMGMKQSSKEFSDQKMIMQEDYKNHIESLTSEVNEVKKRHKEVLIKLANQVEELASKHREENEKIEAKYIEEMQNFEQVLTESRMVEQELATKTLTLTENSNILEKKNKELESEISILREKEDKYLDQYESKMNLLKEMIEKDNVRMNQFRSEKFAEISQQKSTIQMLEKETALKEEKINELIEEKDTLKRQLDDVMSQHDLQESRSSNNAKQNVNQETTKLRYLLSDSLHHTHSTPNLLPTKKFDKENFKSEDNSRYYESVLDKNDPTRFTFNQSYQGRRLESSAEPRASAKQTFKTDGKFHRKGRLSMHDFS